MQWATPANEEESCAELPECPTSLLCPHSKECLIEEWLCDGYKDCKDGTDEKVGWAAGVSRGLSGGVGEVWGSPCPS